MNHVQPKKQGYVQARLLNGDVLKGIDLAGGGDIEERAHFAFANHVVIVGATGARTGGLAGGVLDELADFFLERHFVEKLVKFFLDGGIRESRSGPIGVKSFFR
jgi:hypothetical protein